MAQARRDAEAAQRALEEACARREGLRDSKERLYQECECFRRAYKDKQKLYSKVQVTSHE